MASTNYASKKGKGDEANKRKPSGPVKISPWTLARLKGQEVSKAAADAKRKSKVLQPIARHEIPNPDKTRSDKRARFPSELSLDPLTDSNCSHTAAETSGSLAPLQHQSRSAFRPSAASSVKNMASSPDQSSLDSPDLHPRSASPFREPMNLAASCRLWLRSPLPRGASRFQDRRVVDMKPRVMRRATIFHQ